MTTTSENTSIGNDTETNSGAIEFPFEAVKVEFLLQAA